MASYIQYADQRCDMCGRATTNLALHNELSCPARIPPEFRSPEAQQRLDDWAARRLQE